MKRHRHTPEQVVRKLREGERLLNEEELSRYLGRVRAVLAPPKASSS